MNKIAFTLLDKIYSDKKMTSDELSFIIYICRYADDYGFCRGIYYKDAVSEMGISVSQFYAIKRSLEERGYIKCNKEYSNDIDITISDNCFYIEDENGNMMPYYANYLNINREVFGKEFYSLKLNAKKILLHIIVRGLSAKNKVKGYAKLWHIPKAEYTIYARKFGLSVRMVKEYFKDISKWVGVYSEEGRPYDIITAKEEALNPSKVGIRGQSGIRGVNKQDRFDSDAHFIKTHLRRNGLEADQEELNDATSLISQYINKAIAAGLEIREVFVEALQATSHQTFLVARAINKYLSNKFKKIEAPA